ncbi:hypothetical protein Ahy_B06g084971 isoform E [Arachis hypogaea]|uniref:Aminotransferase-like plant mobile domain-containing protein n=1 Tax=Arachis hypogaea TaxID=3818 RepID=A0A444YT74_ARAHY|nr:hypothetical protein Ahy_B06g084971 isoform E [Arachis hypogaea]
MRRQQGMRLDDRYVPYLQMAGLYHLARLNDRWFRLDEVLVSAFVERWRPETHTFHMPFGECTITLQDVAYQLGLPVDGRYVSGCLSEFHIYIDGGRPPWETFGECPEDADDDTVRRYVRAYIMMLLGTQLFADKSGNRIHIRWLPYVARLEELGAYSWGSAALAWLYQCMCRVANRHVVKLAGPLQLLQSWIFWRFPQFRPAGYETFSWPLASRWAGYNPSGNEKGPRVQMWRLRIDRLQSREVSMLINNPDVLQVLHPEVLEPRHMAVWRSVTALIYFAVIEWHQIDRVLPQFGGVQAPPRPALNIDFLMSKDGRGGDRWFPSSMPKWHAYWDARQDSVLRFDVVADPGPSHEFLQWWSQHGKRFLAADTQLGDPRSVPIPVEASQRGPGRVPDMDPPDDVPDRRRVERRMGVGTRRSQRQWRWPDHRARRGADHGDDDDDQPGHVGGGTHDGGTSTHDGDHGGEWYGTGLGDGADTGDAGPGSGHLGDYFVGVPADDQAEQGGTPWRISGSQWADFVGSDSLVGDFGSPRFLDEITAIMQGDVTPRRGGQTSGIQPPLDVDLNETSSPLSSSIVSGSTSSSSGSPNSPSPTPTGGTPCKGFGRTSKDPTSSRTPSFKSTANDGEATSWAAGS